MPLPHELIVFFDLNCSCYQPLIDFLCSSLYKVQNGNAKTVLKLSPDEVLPKDTYVQWYIARLLAWYCLASLTPICAGCLLPAECTDSGNLIL